jgi:hypothetical protein
MNAWCRTTLRRLQTVALMCAGAATACTTTTSHMPLPETPEPSYRYGISWVPSSRGGAAERAAGYFHVLHRGSAHALSEMDKLKPTVPAVFNQGNAVGQQPPSAVDISRWVDTVIEDSTSRHEMPEKVNERQAWERYCRGGLDLTEEEWRFLTKAGAPENMPRELAPTCIPPK